MLYEFHLQKNVKEAIRSIFTAYGEDALDVRTCQNWFARFKAGDFDLNDRERTGRPFDADVDKLEALLEEDPSQSSRELVVELSVSHTTVCNRLHALGNFQKVVK